MGGHFDAVVVGAGHNGLVAANLLADAGWEVLVLEQEPEFGGAVRSAELFDGFRSDLYSANHPMAVVSPVLRGLGLADHGLRWAHAPTVLAAARTPDDAVALYPDPQRTVDELGRHHRDDARTWLELLAQWRRLRDPLLEAGFGGRHPIRHTIRLVRDMGIPELTRLARFLTLPADTMARELFRSEQARLLLLGNCGHGDLAVNAPLSGATGWLLTMLAQDSGFPCPVGGASGLTDALVARARAGGVELRSGVEVSRLEIRDGRVTAVRTAGDETFTVRRAVIADTPAPALYGRLLPDDVVPPRVREDLRRFEPDSAVVKVNYAVSQEIPWNSPELRGAGTVHLGADEHGLIRWGAELACGAAPSRPFLLLGQMTTCDPTRSPAGTESAWAYTLMPRGVTDDSSADKLAAHIDAVIEAHAPGFGDALIGRNVQRPSDMTAIGTRIGGTLALHQQAVFRSIPGLGGPETFVRGLYLGSSAAHPGGAVHGACGAYAARAALHRNGIRGRARRHLHAVISGSRDRASGEDIAGDGEVDFVADLVEVAGDYVEGEFVPVGLDPVHGRGGHLDGDLVQGFGVAQLAAVDIGELTGFDEFGGGADGAGGQGELGVRLRAEGGFQVGFQTGQARVVVAVPELVQDCVFGPEAVGGGGGGVLPDDDHLVAAGPEDVEGDGGAEGCGGQAVTEEGGDVVGEALPGRGIHGPVHIGREVEDDNLFAVIGQELLDRDQDLRDIGAVEGVHDVDAVLPGPVVGVGAAVGLDRMGVRAVLDAQVEEADTGTQLGENVAVLGSAPGERGVSGGIQEIAECAGIPRETLARIQSVGARIVGAGDDELMQWAVREMRAERSHPGTVGVHPSDDGAVGQRARTLTDHQPAGVLDAEGELALLISRGARRPIRRAPVPGIAAVVEHEIPVVLHLGVIPAAGRRRADVLIGRIGGDGPQRTGEVGYRGRGRMGREDHQVPVALEVDGVSAVARNQIGVGADPLVGVQHLRPAADLQSRPPGLRIPQRGLRLGRPEAVEHEIAVVLHVEGETGGSLAGLGGPVRSAPMCRIAAVVQHQVSVGLHFGVVRTRLRALPDIVCDRVGGDRPVGASEILAVQQDQIPVVLHIAGEFPIVGDEEIISPEILPVDQRGAFVRHLHGPSPAADPALLDQRRRREK
ncbi:NAD(P)/FAD-dependent oxidoreductase [Nocardia seriolae]|nr:NAD(P)/FAD-dependent oxidoreductase [Nocardia seriolae]QUN15942.1 NAD(P)/FAD-dependent oxidoreductase [Nocardia seriolae]